MSRRRWHSPLLLSGFIFFSQAFPLPAPVRDAATFQWAQGFSMYYPRAHLLFTPFCGIADLITVLSYHQGIVLLIWIFAGIFWVGRGVRRAILFSCLVIAFLAWGALVPRPMGRLVAQDPNVLLIDFHSHSQMSHDGRPSFTPEANQQWHRDQGYNASFITDHNRTEAALWAKEDSKRQWRTTGYRSLEGEEVSLYKTHLVLLGNHSPVDNRPYDSDPAKIPIFLSDMAKRDLPVIASLPEYWWYHWGEGVKDFVRWGIKGFEIINSAPKAMDFPLAERLDIVDLCRTQNLFMTGISDNHGYGYATAVWNAMRIPDWRMLGPDALEAGVLTTLKMKRFEAVQVLERVRYTPTNVWQLAVTPVAALFLYWRSLQPLQAIAWVIWIWVAVFLYPSRKSGTQRSGPKS